MTLRIGHGLDSHRLEPGRPLMLGCVPVPSDLGLAGHSDGDAAAHALADACLGAAGLGTMGDHFPSDAERWRGVSGHEFLELVAAKLTQAGARVTSAEVALVCAAAARTVLRSHGGGDVRGPRHSARYRHRHRDERRWARGGRSR
jgi:2-C-methyl-D-erythritol 2,4-cyclodiphosphate synthase